jgi:defect-in-organelle-trafficking protein DotC
MKHNIKKNLIILAISVLAGNVMAQSVPTGKDNPAKFPGGIVPSSGSNYGGPRYQGLGIYSGTEDKRVEKIPEMGDLMSSVITQKAKDKESVAEIKRAALTEIATAMGASAGAAHRMRELKNMINEYASELDVLFSFKDMKLTDGVLLPVITQGLSNYKKSSDDEVRLSDKRFKVDAPAKFVSVYPTWRSYLFFNLPTFEAPPPSMLPKNDAEKAIWDEAVQVGWKRGVEQANKIFETSYSRMEKDFMGMDLAKILLETKVLTPTIVAKQNLGITGGGKEMNINDQIFRITDHSGLNPNSKSWTTEYPVTGNNDGEYK